MDYRLDRCSAIQWITFSREPIRVPSTFCRRFDYTLVNGPGCKSY